MAANTLKYVSECVRTGWISSAGTFIQRFERDFARFCSAKHAVTTTSGTTALHLALSSLNIGPGDEVITSDLTMIAVPYAILYTGASPLLVDVERDTFNIDPSKIEEFINTNCRFETGAQTLINTRTQGRIKAILPIHLYGHPCEMDAILSIARRFNLFVIEDAAEAHGARYYSPKNEKTGQMAGTIGDIGCFSFYANKIITTGEGGMIVTDSNSIAERARRLKDLAHSPEKRFLHTDLAFNYRMTNLQAAVGVAQLEEIERFLQIKVNMARTYALGLKDVEGLTLPVEKEWAKNVYWMYSVLVEDEFGLARDVLMNRLRDKGVDTRTFFFPVHRQPVLSSRPGAQNQNFPVSDELSRKGLYLPSGLALTETQIQTVCEAIKEIRAEL